MLEAAEAELSGTVARLERKVALLMKERTMLKEIVDSYDAEEAIHGGAFLWHLSAAIPLSSCVPSSPVCAPVGEDMREVRNMECHAVGCLVPLADAACKLSEMKREVALGL